MTRVLVIDDDESMCELLQTELSQRKFAVTTVLSAEDAETQLAAREFDVVITDINLRGASGLDLCTSIVARWPDLPVILLTAFGSMDAVIAAIRAGAYDFITKPIEADRLALTIDRAATDRSLRLEIRRLKSALNDGERFEGMIGGSPPMKQMFSLIEKVADSEATVLIAGESGAGKELVAKALHNRSSRRGGPFVAINCAAMPESLLESELFGHTKGAFTDARSARQGLFLKATRGTLFLDEIGEMPAGMQAKLLRALQERTVRPVGGDQEMPFDTRIIAATNRDLDVEVAEKRFREDLYYRVNVVRISVPPLRARGADIALIAKHLLLCGQAARPHQIVGFQAAALEKMLTYAWPGNVRELQNCIERAIALTSYDHIGVEDLSERVRDIRPAPAIVETLNPAELLPMDEVERRYILEVLRAVDGNKSAAAKVLGFDRRTLYRKLERDGAPPDGATDSSPHDPNDSLSAA